MQFDVSHFHVKLAETPDELLAAQRLRYRVFVEEMGALPDDKNRDSRLEYDEFDTYFDHLILIDKNIDDQMNAVVGVYRLMKLENAHSGMGFYSAPEYDLSKLLACDKTILELGRSCVLRNYRGGFALNLLWNGLAGYIKRHQIDLLFGVASFSGTKVQGLEDSLSFLYHYHLAPEELRVTAIGENTVKMDIKEKTKIDKMMAVRNLPPLIKAYIRLGGYVGQDAFVDLKFNTIDVCLILDTNRLSQKHLNIYQHGAT